MAHDMELVEQNRRLWRMGIRRQTEWLPHVHHRQANARTLPLPEPVVELAHARLRAVLPAKPDRATAHEIANHDPVVVTFADRKLVDADHLRSRRASTLELRFHVLLLQHLDRLPVQRQFLRHILDRRLPAAPADKVSKAFGVERTVGCGRKPGNEYASHSRRLRFAVRAIQHSWSIRSLAVTQNT